DENDALRARLAQVEERLREKEAELEAARQGPALRGGLRGFVWHAGAGQLRGIAYALLFAFVFVAGFGTTLGPSCGPALGRIGAPVACPSDYERSPFSRCLSSSQRRGCWRCGRRSSPRSRGNAGPGQCCAPPR